MLLRKFVLVLWKNLVIRKRHWILTTFEIVVPTVLFILCAILQSDSVNIKMDTEYYKNFTMDSCLTLNPVLYAPDNNFTSDLMAEIKTNHTIDNKGFSSEDDLIHYYYNFHNNSYGIVGIVFEDLPANGTMPQHLKYKIRSSENRFYTDSTFLRKFGNGPGNGEWLYPRTDFACLQMLVEKTFIQKVSKAEITNDQYKYNFQQFPHPAYDNDFMVTLFAMMLPFFTLLSFILLCPSIVKRIVEEKETGVKELMKMMGLKDWMLWLGWFINALLVNIVSITIIVIILKLDVGAHPILANSDWFLVWIFLFLYCLAGISFCFFISSFFDRPTLSMSVGIVAWLMSYSTLSFLVTSVNVGLNIKLLSSLLPNMAMSWGYNLIMDFESNHVGLTWDTFLKASDGDDYTIGHIWLMLFVDIFVYNALAWYIGNIIPGKYGIAKPWYFIFMPSYWCSRQDSDMYTSGETSVPASKFEKPPSSLSVGIKIQDLRKVFQTLAGTNKKVAVDGVTIDIYKGEITALLGHNGAGKTTTMSILTGLISPTSGSVHIDGYDIKDNLEKVRESLGLCPQHNMLFTDLTVREHLIFFAMLKGLTKQEAETATSDLLMKLNLTEKKNNMASALSGGMKRKLSLGIALIGHTKVLMLDEPTSGMDPEARREIWDILLKLRGERTILITTHFMEEADVLGDRIAIMDHGKVQCYGTSLFLKKIYGTGYQLSLLKDERCQIPQITSTVESIISGAEMKTDMGSFLSYMLPADETNNFPQLFDILERDKHMLGITSIGVSITTLEEVFLRVGMESQDKLNNHSHAETYNGHMKENGYGEALTYTKRSGVGLKVQQLRALLKKRVIFASRNWIGLSIQILITIFMTIFTLILGDTFGLSKEPEPSLTLNLNLYGATQALYFDPANLFGSKYEDIIKTAGSEARKVTQINEELLKVGQKSFHEYFSKYVIATEFNCTGAENTCNLNAMYSSVALHSFPISMNILSNTILKHLNLQNSITVINHPLEMLKEENAGITDGLPLAMMWLSLMSLGLLTLVGHFIRFPLTERVSKAKQVQLMTGVSAVTYWLSLFLFDILLYLIIAAFLVLMVFVSDPLDIFTGSTELGVYFFMLVMYGFAAIPYAYLFSYFRKTNAGSNALFVIVNMLIGMILSMVVYFMLQSPSYEDIATGLKYVFEFFPQFSMAFGLLRFANQVFSNNICKVQIIDCNLQTNNSCCNPNCENGYCPDLYKPYLEVASSDNTDAVGLELLFLGIDFLIYICLILLIEFDVFTNFNANLLKSSFGTDIQEELLEEDVMKEKLRIKSITEGAVNYNTEDIMLVDNLIKKFKRNFVAVKGVSFGVAPGECFGLLGVNGAGKTTTFRMLTGDEFPTSGNALISDYTLANNKAKFLSQIGYCPQFDAINEALTGREMLTLFANLRGIPPSSINQQVDKWISLMGLEEYKDRRCGTYSGGNKRKLSTALSLIGDPPIIFLDEPTSGVDPVARRNLWGVLTNVQKTGQSVVLTSHSMEECEALCNRLAIMVCGQFMCMGGIQYLKQKFGQGFTIMVKLRVTGSDEQIVDRLKTDIEQNFRTGCILKDEHQGLLHYHVTDPTVPWKHLFVTMENIKHHYTLVEDYTISETTLEQVFLSFAKPQPPIMTTSL